MSSLLKNLRNIGEYMGQQPDEVEYVESGCYLTFRVPMLQERHFTRKLQGYVAAQTHEKLMARVYKSQPFYGTVPDEIRQEITFRLERVVKPLSRQYEAYIKRRSDYRWAMVHDKLLHNFRRRKSYVR